MNLELLDLDLFNATVPGTRFAYHQQLLAVVVILQPRIIFFSANMRSLLSFAAVLSTVFAQSFLAPAPISAVQPILNGTAEYESRFHYSPSAPP